MKMSKEEQAERTERVWGGDWQSRIRGLLHANGFETVREVLANYPAEPYTKVGKHLGDDIAGFQILQLQYQEALDCDGIRDVAADALAREIAGKLKRGWGRKMHRDFNRAHAFSSWIGAMRNYAPDFESSYTAVWNALLQFEPPDDWVPNGPNDPIIADAFETGWPESNI